MKRYVVGRLLFLILLLWTSRVFAADERLERLVPEGSLGLISFQGWKQSAEKFKETTLFQIFQSPELSETTSKFWEQIRQGYEEVGSKFAHEMGFEVAELLDIFGGKITLALVSLNPEEFNKNPKALPDVVFLADVSGHRDRLKELIDTKVLPKIKKEDPKTKVATEKYKSISLTTLTDKDGVAISYAFLGDTFTVSLKPALMRKIIDLQGQGGKSMAGNSSYNSVAEAVARDKSEFHAYVDMRKVLDLAKKQMIKSTKPSDRQAVKFLDYYNLNSLSWSLAVENGGFKDRLFIQTYPSEKGLWTEMLKNLQGIPLTSESMIPADVLYYQSSLTNWVQIWRYLLTTLKEVMPPQEYQKFETGLTFLREGLKLDPEKDLLENLGEEVVVALNVKGLNELMAGGKASPDNFPFLLMLKTKNPAGLQKTLTQLATLFQLQFQQDKMDNITIQYLEIPTPNFPVRLNYAFINDFWVLSLTGTMIKEVIQAPTQKAALMNNPDYEGLKSHFSEENVIGRGYINLKGVLKLIALAADKGMASLNQSLKGAPGLDQVKLPELGQIADALFGMMWVSTTREDGFTLEFYSPVGGMAGLSILGGLGSLVGALATSSPLKQGSDSSNNAEQTKTMADMRVLTTAIEAYRVAKGALPENLESLAPEYLPEVPMKDAWGNEFIYEIGEDNETYTLISLGKDGAEGGEGLNMDIVVEDGEFIAGPGVRD